MGLMLEVGKSLFVKERSGKIVYYIFSSDIDSISKGQRRDIDIISRLWEDNFEDPSNVIRQTENISGSSGDYRFQVYSLPSRPLRLTDDFVNSIDIEQKLNIITGLCRGVESIHNYETPLFHRNINPDAFYIFNIRGKYKPLLAKFDCTKDSADAAFTVFQNVKKKACNQNTNQFFAPEVIKSNMGIGVDWEKADIYSLAKTIVYIILGKVIEDSDCLADVEEIDDELKIILMEMLDENPKNRPDLKELLETLSF
jgi:serine/threonine protein kinase